MRFVKMHGIGNDFVVVDGAAEKVPADAASLARGLCDRHTGLGADGPILVGPPAVQQDERCSAGREHAENGQMPGLAEPSFAPGGEKLAGRVRADARHPQQQGALGRVHLDRKGLRMQARPGELGVDGQREVAGLVDG